MGKPVPIVQTDKPTPESVRVLSPRQDQHQKPPCSPARAANSCCYSTSGLSRDRHPTGGVDFGLALDLGSPLWCGRHASFSWSLTQGVFATRWRWSRTSWAGCKSEGAWGPAFPRNKYLGEVKLHTCPCQSGMSAARVFTRPHNHHFALLSHISIIPERNPLTISHTPHTLPGRLGNSQSVPCLSTLTLSVYFL